VTRRGILVACLLALGTSPGLADSDQDAARHAFETGKALPFERILDRARREHPGRLLEAEIEKEGGRLVYELRILAPDGRIGEWRYDARTGEPDASERHQKIPRRGED
jgi:uncharacterized membrane protein YkoI